MKYKLTKHELDTIILALEFFASEGSGTGDLEIEKVRELANKLASYLAKRPPGY